MLFLVMIIDIAYLSFHRDDTLWFSLLVYPFSRSKAATVGKQLSPDLRIWNTFSSFLLRGEYFPVKEVLGGLGWNDHRYECTILCFVLSHSNTKTNITSVLPWLWWRPIICLWIKNWNYLTDSVISRGRKKENYMALGGNWGSFGWSCVRKLRQSTTVFSSLRWAF